MESDSFQLDRLRNLLNARRVQWEEKRMFGGNCFMVEDKMCFGTYKGGLMARVDPEEMAHLLEKEGAAPMIHGGRTMSGFMFVSPEACDADKDLDFWIGKCLEFNPRAKSSKKK